VRGYLPFSADGGRTILDPNAEQENVRELSQRRANLILELKNYEENQRVAAAAAKATATMGSTPTATAAVAAAAAAAAGGDSKSVGVIPAGTQLSTALALNLGSEDQPVSMKGTSKLCL
jgi:Bardet-Biedl syndrome 2 protein